MNETAILLTGLIRLHNDELVHHWNALKKTLQKYDVFVCTYKECFDNARQIAPDENILIIDETVDSYINDPGWGSGNAQYQMIQLEESLLYFEDKLSKFNHFIRIRNDMYWGDGDIEACFEEIIDVSKEGYSTCRFDFMYGGPVKKWIHLAKEERIKKHLLKEKHMFDLPIDYHNYLKSIKKSSQLNDKSYYNKAFWQFPHDIELMYTLNKKYNFKLQEDTLQYFYQKERKEIKCIKFRPENNKHRQQAEEFLTEICNVKIKEGLKSTDHTKWGFYYDVNLSPLLGPNGVNPGPLLFFWVLDTGPAVFHHPYPIYKKDKFITLVDSRK